MPADWNHLLAVAQEEVKAVISSLPRDLKQAAETLPIVFDPQNNESLRQLDSEDTLGLFVGASHPNASEETEGIPPQIILFLANIWSFAEKDEPTYRQEVQTTYLHELGHYLGLEEVDLEERGLL